MIETASSPRTLREGNDPELWPLIDAADDRAREQALEALVTELAKPLIASLVRRFRRMEPGLQIEDAEEISSLVALRVIRKMRAAAVYEEHAILSLADYIARITYNALYDFRRSRHPERHRLKRNLRFILTHQPELALWESADEVVAGLASWNGQPARFARGVLSRASATSAMCDRTHPVEALDAILRRIGYPIAFESLVDLVAELWDVRDIVLEANDFPPDDQRDALSSLEQREYLEALWVEIRELPDNQRAALLLNLRDAGGSNALTLFLLLNIATANDVAVVVGLSEEQLNELWTRLPLDDYAIAERLRLTRQQVINLRKSARMRLARRMAKWR